MNHDYQRAADLQEKLEEALGFDSDSEVGVSMNIDTDEYEITLTEAAAARVVERLRARTSS